MSSHLQGKRIFIVEDNTINRVIYRTTLGMLGSVLGFSEGGKETLDQLLSFNPHLIILDLMLPRGASGYDMFVRIRTLSKLDHVPIVAISASDPSIALHQCVQAGFSGFIAKPIEEELLPDQLARLLQGEPVWYMGTRYGGQA